MKRGIGLGLVVVLLGVGAAMSQMGPGMGQGMGGHGMYGVEEEGGIVARHQLFMRQGVPIEYAQASNPLKTSPEVIAVGKILFAQNCVACHGPSGKGDGPAATGLKPPPANLALIMKMPIASDAYLDWTISEGGMPVGSVMPAFKAMLKPEQVWQVVSYLRTL